MSAKYFYEISEVKKGSISESLGVAPKDKLCQINGKTIEDILDYYFVIEDNYLEVTILKPNGEEWILEIEKDEDEDLGLIFKDDLMRQYKSCTNKCMFCFIDQLPKGMRETLYFKDDDSTLSFLKGNYITFTNMKEQDIDRIIKYRMSPINISVHTTNLDLRKKMLNNKNANKILSNIEKLANAHITMNCQIVLCKNINDGKELDKTISDLSLFIPNIQSVSVVPVGLSKYREGLYPLESFNASDAKKVINQIKKWQDKIYKDKKVHFIHASDEFYILANDELPNSDKYDGYLQIENGVGMMRSFIDEFNEEFFKLEYNKNLKKEISLATSKLPLKYIKWCTQRINEKYPNIKINLYAIINHFFGENITVSGLLTGHDIIEQLKDKNLGEELLLPCNILKSGETILLDDISINDIEKELNTKIRIVNNNGQDFIYSIINKGE